MLKKINANFTGISFQQIYTFSCNYFQKKTNLYCRNISQYDDFANQKKADDASSPESLPEYDRPAPRHIDRYIRPEIPCLTKRATVAVLSCLGFIIMFGMRTSMGIVKLELVSVLCEK